MNTAALPTKSDGFVYVYNDRNTKGKSIKIYTIPYYEGDGFRLYNLKTLGEALGAPAVHVWRYDDKQAWYIDFVDLSGSSIFRMILPEDAVTKITVGEQVVWKKRESAMYVYSPEGCVYNA